MRGKLWKKAAAIVLTAVLAVSLFMTAEVLNGVGAVFVQAAEIVDSGSCGNNLTWTLDSDGLLIISGNGDMENHFESGFNSNGDYYESYRSHWDKNKIKKIIIQEGVKNIGHGTFSYNKNLTSIEFPEGLTSIGNNAFSNCSSLTSIEIPESVTSIGRSAFSGCSSLMSFKIPESVTNIGDYAFSGCSSLTSFEIPENVTSIGGYVFYNCSSLTSFVIPENVTSIGNNAFSGCSSLTSFMIPENVTSIGNYILSNCSSLANIEIPKNITSIMNGMFSGCSSLTSFEIPENVTSIGNNAFSNCSSLTSFEIPENVTSIGDYAFSGCSNLTSIEIPKSVASIGKSAFFGCTGFRNVEIPDSVIAIGDSAFKECSNLESIVLSNSITEIPASAFQTCRKLEHLVIPRGVKSIRTLAFQNCDLIKNVYIPKGVNEIGQYAFGYYREGSLQYTYPFKKVDGFTILGAKNSAAYNYAQQNGFSFNDCSSVEETIAAIPSNLSDYTDESVSALSLALDKVNAYFLSDQQADLNLISEEILEAIQNLQLKSADYSLVDMALKRIPDDLSGYTTESVRVLQQAKNNVERNKTICEQDKVNRMAEDILTAVNHLEKTEKLNGVGLSVYESGMLLSRYIMEHGSYRILRNGQYGNKYLRYRVAEEKDGIFYIEIDLLNDSTIQFQSVFYRYSEESYPKTVSNFQYKLNTNMAGDINFDFRLSQNEQVEMKASFDMATISEENYNFIDKTAFSTIDIKNWKDYYNVRDASNMFLLTYASDVLEKCIGMSLADLGFISFDSAMLTSHNRIVLDQSKILMKPSDNRYLYYQILTEQGVDKEVYFSSDNPQIAQIDENGLITAVNPGVATVKVSMADDPDVSVSCSVWVNEHNPKRVERAEPDYETNGHTAYWLCEDCGKYFEDELCTLEIPPESIVLPALHRLSIVDAVMPSKFEAGNIKYWECEDCHKLFRDDSATIEISAKDVGIPALGSSDPNDRVIYDSAQELKTFLQKYGTSNEFVVQGIFTSENIGGVVSEFSCDLVADDLIEFKFREKHGMYSTYYPISGASFYYNLHNNTVTSVNVYYGIDTHYSASARAAINMNTINSKTSDFPLSDYTCNYQGINRSGVEQNFCLSVQMLLLESEIFLLENMHYSLANLGFINYSSFLPVHNLSNVAQTATCMHDGTREYWKCKTCGKLFADKDGQSQLSENDIFIKATGHKNQAVPSKAATIEEEGNIDHYHCTVCDKLFSDSEGINEITKDSVTIPKLIDISNATVTGLSAKTYTSKAFTPVPTVKVGSKTLVKDTDFTVSYKNNKNAGTATVTITGKGKYASSLNKTFKIKQAINPLKVSLTSKTYKQAKLKNNATFNIKAANAQGKVTYTLTKAATKAGIKVTAKGKVTVPKKCKKGTYKITVKAIGDKNYKAGSKTVTIKVTK